MTASYGNQVRTPQRRKADHLTGRSRLKAWVAQPKKSILSWSTEPSKVVLLRPPPDTRDEDPSSDFIREARTALLNLRASVANTRSREGLVQQLATIASAWEDLDACSRALESQAVVLCAKIGSKSDTSRDPAPEWVLTLMSELENDPRQMERVHPVAVQTASAMLAALEKTFAHEGKTLEQCVVVEVDGARNGAVEVMVSSDVACVQWKIRPSELPWPLVDVLAVERFGVGRSARREIRSYRLAQSAVSGGFKVLARTK